MQCKPCNVNTFTSELGGCILLSSSINWNYCVLDEGHVIKNGKTKVSATFDMPNSIQTCALVQQTAYLLTSRYLGTRFSCDS